MLDYSEEGKEADLRRDPDAEKPQASQDHRLYQCMDEQGARKGPSRVLLSLS